MCTAAYKIFRTGNVFILLEKRGDTLQVKFHVRVQFLYNKFNIEIHTSFPS